MIRSRSLLARLGPDLGAHNEDVYAGLLHLTPDEIETLKAEGII
jgi:crotonobetainyl-CoA:carnitine CoA-transferase CaiB-like acyl-CoA transferase